MPETARELRGGPGLTRKSSRTSDTIVNEPGLFDQRRSGSNSGQKMLTGNKISFN